MNACSEELCQHLIKDDPEIDFRIKNGIEMYRKGFARIRLVDSQGKEVENAKIMFRQLNHEFIFGCNAFLLNQLGEDERNKEYENKFKNLFNEAVLPFFWSDLEPEDGKVRFDKGSIPIYRRPPIDELLEFCESNNIRPKGHPLVWHEFSPEWAPTKKTEMMLRISDRIEEIAERYGKRIKRWDCVNEALTRHATVFGCPQLPDNHVDESFKIAERYLTHSKLLYNDGCDWWNYYADYSPVYMLVKGLLDRGRRIDGLGFEYHMFDHHLPKKDKTLNPRHLYRCFDQYLKLGIPVNMSEVSIISHRRLGDGDKFQELVTEKLYKIWFSHPVMEGITWWNLVDGTAAYAPLGSEAGENSLRAGLLNFDLTPKPAYKVLERLINKEWHSEGSMEYHVGDNNQFHGFYGDYELSVDIGDCEVHKKISLSKDSDNTFVIKI